MNQTVKCETSANPPRRQRGFRSDKSIEKAIAEVAELLGLPVEAVKLAYPSGVSAHTDSNIGNLRKQWEKWETFG
jgi:hypothetical protein